MTRTDTSTDPGLANLQMLTAHLETVFKQIDCSHESVERQELLLHFRLLLECADEVIFQEFRQAATGPESTD